MKIGILICDHVKLEVQEKFGDYPFMFAQLFPEFEFTPYFVCDGHFPTSIEGCDAYMCTGSSFSVYDDVDWIIRLKSIVKDIYEKDKYFVGICFGHQLIGEALGGKVQKSPNGWCVGVHTFDVFQQKKWMQPAVRQFNILAMCQDQIIELPPQSEILAGNKMCPVGIIQVGKKVLGIQGHPEFNKSYNRFLMESRVDRMGKKVVDKGTKSLEMNIDKALLRQWVFEFLNYE